VKKFGTWFLLAVVCLAACTVGNLMVRWLLQ